jgi:uncharacterized protein (TIGR03435 family)
MLFRRVYLALSPVALLAQLTTSPGFEVASVKRVAQHNAPPLSGRTGFSPSVDPLQIRYAGTTLKNLLMQAYNLKSYQISGPVWLDDERYDIVAKIPEGATKEQVPAMLQGLLAERFRLRVHWESKEQRVYALVAGRNGPHLAASKESAVSQVPGTDSQPVANRLSFSPDGHVELTGATLPSFANMLSNFLGSPVMDATGIQGVFDITLNITMEDLSALRSRTLVPDANLESGHTVPEHAASGSIFSAMQELGLKLEARRTLIKHLVVDGAEKVPTDN